MRPKSAEVPAQSLAPATERRAKRIGGPFLASSYHDAKSLVATTLKAELAARALSQQRLADAACVSPRLVQAWSRADGANGLRIDLALAVGLDGGAELRAVMVALLRAVLARLDTV